MSIIMFLGKDVNDYEANARSIVNQAFSDNKLLCELKQTPLKMHMCYTRWIKQGPDKPKKQIMINFVICKSCSKRHGHALIPDFLLLYKQYSADEIESAIIDSAELPVKEIDSDASEPTVRRWIKQVGGRIVGAIGRLKAIFMEIGRVINEVRITSGHCYTELEQILEIAPFKLKYSGNKLGLANMWLGRRTRRMYI